MFLALLWVPMLANYGKDWHMPVKAGKLWHMSGYEKVTVRLPVELVQRVREVAADGRRSLNAQVALLLEDGLGEEHDRAPISTASEGEGRPVSGVLSDRWGPPKGGHAA